MAWKTWVSTVASGAENYLDELKQRFEGNLEPLEILAYMGYGTKEIFHLKGRVLEKKDFTTVEKNDSALENLLNIYRHFESDEVPDIQVQARYGALEKTSTTDEEGYFEFRFDLPTPPDPTKIWHQVELKIALPDQASVQAQAEVLVPPDEAQFGVISDIDDTVVQTNATNLLKMAEVIFLKNIHTRQAFKGVASFYQALQAGHNPIFYVSSSPWNLYTLLTDFFTLQDIPLGPLFLQDYGLGPNKLLYTSHKEHKLTQIEAILSTYPHLPFILIGDSGQRDPYIYRDVVQREAEKGRQDRIQAIYIRDVTSERQDRKVKAIAEELRDEFNVELIFTDDTFIAAQHAAKKGFISPDYLTDWEA